MSGLCFDCISLFEETLAKDRNYQASARRVRSQFNQLSRALPSCIFLFSEMACHVRDMPKTVSTASISSVVSIGTSFPLL